MTMKLRQMLFSFLAVLWTGIFYGNGGRAEEISDRTCIGTDLNSLMDFDFKGCTHIVGNLNPMDSRIKRLTFQEQKNFFLGIKEIHGYLLIENQNLEKLIFSNLHTIRGESLYRVHVEDPEYALLVVDSEIDFLAFPALDNIFRGSVGIYSKKRMCNVETVRWEVIMKDENAEYHYFPQYDEGTELYSKGKSESACDKCHESCENGCWGLGADQCQKVLSDVRCGPTSVCNEAEGCTVSPRSDCRRCIQGKCKDSCLPGQYILGSICVDSCPPNTVIDEDGQVCLLECPSNKYNRNGKCEFVNGKLCRPPSYSNELHSGDLKHFQDCTILDGDIFLSFETSPRYRKNFTYAEIQKPINFERLEVFKTVIEISGSLTLSFIDSPKFINLTCFRNLEYIGRHQKDKTLPALRLRSTSLRKVSFNSLEKIFGYADIVDNHQLCYVSSINWSNITGGANNLIFKNKKDDECQKEGYICSDLCFGNGCWGPDPEDCRCSNYNMKGRSVSSCPDGTYTSGCTCIKCHQNCRGGCTGPNGNLGEKGCNSCHQSIFYKRGKMNCIQFGEDCPRGHFRALLNPRSERQYPVLPWEFNLPIACIPCHEDCEEGCTGSSNELGDSGCNSCGRAIIYPNNTARCMGKDEKCREGYHLTAISPNERGKLKNLAEKLVCRNCHPLCSKCNAYGVEISKSDHQGCQECTFFQFGTTCVEKCPQKFYGEPMSKQCLPCAEECQECTGPTSLNCKDCTSSRVNTSGETNSGKDTNSSSVATNAETFDVYDIILWGFFAFGLGFILGVLCVCCIWYFWRTHYCGSWSPSGEGYLVN